MSTFPAVRGRDLIQALVRAGFSEIRTKGSHHFLRHADGRTTVVPVHASETIGVGLLGQILRDCRLTRAELQKLL